ncbi:MAG: cytidine deaminase [Devosia sp.]
MLPPSESAAIEQDIEDALLTAATKAAHDAYAPYSGFHVGAAVRTGDGTVITAANVENVSYGLSLCAEANAIAAAAIKGARRLTHVAVVGYRAAEPDTPSLAFPCGRCRQMIAEFADADTVILVADRAGQERLKRSFAEILPYAFLPDALSD